MRFPFPENKALKYGYSNARVRGMKGLLLSSNYLDELIKVPTIPEMAELLQRTHYKEHIAALSLKHSGSSLIELAAGRHFVEVVNRVRHFTPKSDKQILNGLLKRWDLLNLKVVLIAMRSGKSFDEIKDYLFSLGSMSIEDFGKIAKADDEQLLKVIKSTPIGKELFSLSMKSFSKRMLESFNESIKKKDNFAQVQIILGIYGYLFAEKALESTNRDVKKILKILRNEIDAKNILIIERIKKYKKTKYDNQSIPKYLISGGASKSLIDEILLSKDLDTTAKILSKRFKEFTVKSKSELSLVDLEIAFEKALAYEKSKIFFQSNLSIGVILGFLLLKEEEMNNLRKIAMAKELGFSEADTKEMLVT